jgi:hypothetical protein
VLPHVQDEKNLVPPAEAIELGQKRTSPKPVWIVNGPIARSLTAEGIRGSG